MFLFLEGFEPQNVIFYDNVLHFNMKIIPYINK